MQTSKHMRRNHFGILWKRFATFCTCLVAPRLPMPATYARAECEIERQADGSDVRVTAKRARSRTACRFLRGNVTGFTDTPGTVPHH
jgi:hypothetical protein